MLFMKAYASFSQSITAYILMFFGAFDPNASLNVLLLHDLAPTNLLKHILEHFDFHVYAISTSLENF